MVINLVVGVYIPIIRIPHERWDDHPQYKELISVQEFFHEVSAMCACAILVPGRAL